MRPSMPPAVTPEVQGTLACYAHTTPGVRTQLARMLMHGALAGTGRLLIYPVDQGVEHGPARSFAAQPAGLDPRHHVRLAQAAGCSAYAAPLGALEAAVDEAPLLPRILKVNGSDGLGGPHGPAPTAEPCPARLASVADALRLGCSAVGFTLYGGSGARNAMVEQLRELIAEARAAGLASVVWAYPRGGTLSRAGEQAVDVVGYAAHIACQLGADVIKVKPPSAHVEQAAAAAHFGPGPGQIPIATLAQRAQHVVASCFAGRRMVLFSGGPAQGREAVLEEVRALAAGGATGCIVGRNLFMRPWDEALQLAADIAAALRATREPAP